MRDPRSDLAACCEWSHEGDSGTRLGPEDVQFWGAMSAAIIVGFVVTYPVNWWLVASGRKHGMASSMAMGHGGHAPHPGHGMPADAESAGGLDPA